MFAINHIVLFGRMSKAMDIVKKMLRGCGELFCSRGETESLKFEKKVFKCKDETIIMEKHFLCLKKKPVQGGFYRSTVYFHVLQSE